MKLTVLGKYGPYPEPGNGANSCYLLEDNGTRILMDMGTGSLARLQSVTDIASVDAIYISHLHYDHTSDLLPFRYLLDTLGVTVNIITHKENSAWYDILFDSPRFNMTDSYEGANIRVGELELEFFRMCHPVTDHAIKIHGSKTFVYTGDTVMCDELYNAVNGADAVLCDCAKPAEFSGPHMSGNDALKLVNDTGIKIIATHFAPGFVPDKSMTDNENIIFAQEMTSYEI